MKDPLDHPPVDHGSDRYGYVEVQAPGGVRPLGEWWDEVLAQPCADCNANLFAQHLGGDPWQPASWHLTYAHDHTCPSLPPEPKDTHA